MSRIVIISQRHSLGNVNSNLVEVYVSLDNKLVTLSDG